jgi:hypothetical protein
VDFAKRNGRLVIFAESEDLGRALHNRKHTTQNDDKARALFFGIRHGEGRNKHIIPSDLVSWVRREMNRVFASTWFVIRSFPMVVNSFGYYCQDLCDNKTCLDPQTAKPEHFAWRWYDATLDNKKTSKEKSEEEIEEMQEDETDEVEEEEEEEEEEGGGGGRRGGRRGGRGGEKEIKKRRRGRVRRREKN